MSELPKNISPEDLASMLGQFGGLPGMGGAGPSEIAGLTGSLAISPSDTLSQILEAKDKTVPGWIMLPSDAPAPIDPATLAMLYNNTVNNIVSFIADQMVKTAAEMSDAQKEEWKNRIRLGLEDFFSYTAAPDGTGRTAAVVGSVSAMLMMSASLLGVIQTPAVAGMDATQFFGLFPALVSSVPPAMQSSMIALGAFLTVGFSAPVFYSLALESGQKGVASKDDAFAAPYAALVALGVENGKVRELAEKLFQGHPEMLTDEFLGKIELSILFGSLVALDKAETGWVNPEEVLNLLSGGSIYQSIQAANPHDPRLGIARLIQERLRKTSKEDREAFIVTHLNYYKDSKDVDNLTGQGKLISAVWSNMDYEQLTENAV